MRMPTKACIGASGLALLCAGPLAFAQVDTQCLQRWQQAVATRSVGERCNYLDAASSARLKALEDKSLECAGAKASAADKTQLTSNAAKLKDKTISEMAATPCSDSAKSSVASEAAQLMK